MIIEIENQLELVKEIVDNSEHVLIDEDKLFTYVKNNQKKIEFFNGKIKEDIKVIIANLIKLQIIKYDNSKGNQLNIELEAAAKLIIHLIKIQTKLSYIQIINYLSTKNN